MIRLFPGQEDTMTLWVAVMLVMTAQAAPASSAASSIASIRTAHEAVQGFLSKAASMVSEDLYAFKPTPEVRSMGELFAHVADANFGICGMASGQKPPMTGIEKSKKTKAELTAALAESFKFCDAAFAGLTDANANETVKFFLPGTHTRLGVLAFNNAHQFEHYGNVVTYMRMKGMVPPSSAGK
jgi:uncharacterized damage-inducible protein DinB